MIYFRQQKLTHADQERFSLRFGPFAEDAYTSGIPARRYDLGQFGAGLCAPQ
jgi:taurine dioxygenase